MTNTSPEVITGISIGKILRAIGTANDRSVHDPIVTIRSPRAEENLKTATTGAAGGTNVRTTGREREETGPTAGKETEGTGPTKGQVGPGGITTAARGRASTIATRGHVTDTTVDARAATRAIDGEAQVTCAQGCTRF